MEREPKISPAKIIDEDDGRMLNTVLHKSRVRLVRMSAILPYRPIPLDELRARLLHPSTSYTALDAALDILSPLT